MGVMEIYLKMKKIRVLNQDDWKRTQVRVPPDLYEDLTEYAENKNISLNTAIITLVQKALDISSTSKGLGKYPIVDEDSDLPTVLQEKSNIKPRVTAAELLKLLENSGFEIRKK